MSSRSSILRESVIEHVLERLGFSGAPEISYTGLREVYTAWCRNVPFDNVYKLMHVARADSSPLPGDNALEFFSQWLQHGTGGTCWAGNGALAEFLYAIGFDACRGAGMMMVAPEMQPNHGTVIVTIDRRHYMVDASMLHVEPILLDADETRVAHPAWGLNCTRRDGKWYIRWRSIHTPRPFDCRIDQLACTPGDFSRYHEATRGWSPFNFSAYARCVRGMEVVGLAFGKHVVLDAEGVMHSRQITEDERHALLIEQIGISEELVLKLPPDSPLPRAPRRAEAGLASK